MTAPERVELDLGELAKEHRGEARTFRRSLMVASVLLVSLGLLYLDPYVELAQREAALGRDRDAKIAEYDTQRERGRQLEQAKDELNRFQEDVKAKARAVSLGAQQHVARARDAYQLMIGLAVTPPTNQAMAPPGPVEGRRILKNEYRLTDAELNALSGGGEDAAATTAMVSEISDRIILAAMEEAEQELREYTEARRRQLGRVLPDLVVSVDEDSTLTLDLEVKSRRVQRPPSLPPLREVPVTTDLKDEHLAGHAGALSEAERFLQEDVTVAIAGFEVTRQILATEVTRLQKAADETKAAREEAEAAVVQAAQSVKDHVLPFGILPGDAKLITRYFPLMLALGVAYFVGAARRLRRSRRQLLAAAPEVDQPAMMLLLGPEAAGSVPGLLVLGGGFCGFMMWRLGALPAGAPSHTANLLAAVLVLASAVRFYSPGRA